MPNEPTNPGEGLWSPTEPAAEDQPPATGQLAGPGIGGDGDPLEPAAETEIWAGRTHWKHYIGRLTLWLLANVAFLILLGSVTSWAGWAGWTLAVVFVLSGLIVVGGVGVKVLGTRYRLTSQRLFIERGIIRQTIDQTELIRIDDVRLTKGVMDRVFGLGSVETLSTDATDRKTVILGIAEPEKVAEAIRTRIRTMRKRSLFVENL